MAWNQERELTVVRLEKMQKQMESLTSADPTDRTAILKLSDEIAAALVFHGEELIQIAFEVLLERSCQLCRGERSIPVYFDFRPMYGPRQATCPACNGTGTKGSVASLD